MERARRILPGLEVLSLYGRSENMVTTMCNAGDDPQLSTTSDGRPPKGVEAIAVDDRGHELAVGEQGDLAYRGPGHMLAYFGNPELTAEMFTADGFSRSGDLGFVNEAGYVRVTGRLKEIIIRGGMNISAREIEELLLGHPDLRRRGRGDARRTARREGVRVPSCRRRGVNQRSPTCRRICTTSTT